MVLKWYCDLHIIVGTSLSIVEKILILGFIIYNVGTHIIDYFVFFQSAIFIFPKKIFFLKQKICSKHENLKILKNAF